MKTRKLQKMGKRNFLKSLASLGVSVNALEYMTRESLEEVTDNPKSERVRVFAWEPKNREEFRDPPYPKRAPEREPIFYTIPEDEWEFIESSNDGRRKIQAIINNLDGTGLVAAGAHVTNDERPIIVDYCEIYAKTPDDRILINGPDIEFEKLEEHLPSSIDGEVNNNGKLVTRKNIPVSIERRKKFLDHSCGLGPHYDNIYNDVPGGCQVQIHRPDKPWWQPQVSNCTATMPAYDLDLFDYVIITAGHCTYDYDGGSENPGDGIGRDVGQHDLSFDDLGEIGKVVSSGQCDGATIEITESGRGQEFSIADTSSNSYDESIEGILSWQALDDNKVDWLYKQGRTTGRCVGTSWTTHDSGCKYILCDDIDSESGDSGGPYFVTEPGDNAYIATLHTGSTGDYSYSTYIGDIMDELNVEIS